MSVESIETDAAANGRAKNDVKNDVPGDRIKPGLEGVVVTTTRLSSVDGDRGELVIAGYPVEELAPNATFEQVVFLLWNDRLPDADEERALRRELARWRALPEPTIDLLRRAAAMKVDPMDALRMALGSLFPVGDEATEDGWRRTATMLVARTASAAATYGRLIGGGEPVEPRPDLGHAASYLHMLTGTEPDPARTRALETYLNTVVDHGLNASTFTARVITSTNSDLVSAIVGAVGALKGPLHGGAPGPALDMVFEIGSPERAEPVIRGMLERGDRLMGFGHRVYKVRDPRADVLAAAAERLYREGADRRIYDLATEVERTALRLLEEYKPGRRLQTNVEFYTALVLHGIGIPTPMFTPTFAAGRVAGWIAHALEQRRANRLIRPSSLYDGPRGRRWE